MRSLLNITVSWLIDSYLPWFQRLLIYALLAFCMYQGLTSFHLAYQAYHIRQPASLMMDWPAARPYFWKIFLWILIFALVYELTGIEKRK